MSVEDKLPPLEAALSRSAEQAALTLDNFATSPANPRNWSRSKKWRITLMVSLTSFISTCGSSIGVPGIHAIMQEFGESNDKVGVLPISTYVLGLGCGPFLSAPLSELYGRQTAYLLSLVPYGLFCLGTATSQNMASLIVLRFFGGMFGSTAPSLGVATIADVWDPTERGRPMSIYGLGPMAGPVVGSMIGYWILNAGWRWDFWTITIMSFANFVAFVFTTEETHAPTIEKVLGYQVLHPQVEADSFLQRISPRRFVRNLAWMKAMVSREDAKAVFGRAFSRPPRLLFLNPVCLLFSAYYAYIYAIIYLFLVSVPLMFGSLPFDRPPLFSYQWSLNTLPLAYIGLSVGFGIAAVLGATCQDRIYRHLTKRSGAGVGQPEYRLVMTQIGMCLLPIGLFITGWTANAETHWIGPQFGMVFVACGLMMAFHSIQNFIVDAFFPYSAAAIAAATAARSVAACVLPLFTADLFSHLHWGLGGTLLGCVALVGVPAPAIMFIWGKKLRDRFQFQG